MMYIQKMVDYLKILSDDEGRDFEDIDFGECFKYAKEIVF